MFKATKPYNNSSLEPYISQETQMFHFEKHHIGYANNLNDLAKGTNLENLELNEILKIKNEIDAKIYNNAGQLFNHDFYWNSLSLNKEKPEGKIMDLITNKFENISEFQSKYINKANELFGSGWSWVIYDKSRQNLEFINTQNADIPAIFDGALKPILVIDLWEHAYYIDYRNDRKKYIETIIRNCLNWEFASFNLNSD